MKKVLVAGATGQLGKCLTRELKECGYWVRAIVRDPAKLQTAGVDEVVTANITDSHSLKGVCEGVDLAVSCAGAAMNINKFSDRNSFYEVDYKGNLNLLREAQESSVSKFCYVSLAGAEKLRHTEYADAHEQFVEALKSSGLDYTVIRPTGFFSFLLEVLKFAKKNRGVVIGAGYCKTNPVHEADVARACVSVLETEVKEMTVGGPDVYTRKQITELAFEVLGRKPKLMSIPPLFFKPTIQPLRLLNHRIYALMDFGVAVTQVDVVAPAYGLHRLKAYFEDAAGKL